MTKNLDANVARFEQETLANGLQVIYHLDKSAPIVSTVVHYKVGSKDEDLDKTGYAHFFEHLMFEATENIDRSNIAKYINEAGGWLNAHTSFDETVYKFKVPSNEIKLALWIESQRMMGLKVDEIGVNTQKNVVIEEKKQRYDNQPYGSMLEKMLFNLFPKTNYSWPVIGSVDHIQKATVNSFAEFYHNFYRPSNAILVISGDFILEDTKKYVDEYFGILDSLPSPNRKLYVNTPLIKDYREKINDPKAPLDAVFIGFRGPVIGSDDYYAMNLLTNILATGESSRFYQNLVSKENLAAQTSMMPLSLEADGAILFVALANPEKDINLIEKLIYKEIENVALNSVTEKELEKTKNIMEMDLISEKKDVLEKAMNLARYKAYFDNPDLINDEIDRYSKVTLADIQNVAKKYLVGKNKVVLNYTPSK